MTDWGLTETSLFRNNFVTMNADFCSELIEEWGTK